MKKILLNLYFFPLFILVTVGALTLIPFLRFINRLTVRKPEDSAFRKGIRIYGWILSKILSLPLPVHLEDKSGGLPDTAIFTANHASSADPYCFGLLQYENAFLTSWPFTIPVFKWAMKKSGYLDARTGWEEISPRGKKLLDRGCSLIIWPEGHRSRDGNLGVFRNGAFQLACETGYPIVPVCIIGTDKLLPPGHHLLSPAAIKMVLLPPCEPELPPGELERKTVMAMKKKVYQRIQSELEYQHQTNDIQKNRSHPRAAQTGI